MDLSIILPSYQEEKNLEIILPQLNEELLKDSTKYELLIVDTQEPMDNTREVCIKNNATYINRKNGNNYGDAIRTGINQATGRYILIMDADGSHNTKDVVRLFNKIKDDNLDVVIGSRYCCGGSTKNSILSKCMSQMLNIVYRNVFGLEITDVSNSFRIYSAERIKSLQLECNNFDIIEELLVLLCCSDKTIRIAEIPIEFNKRNNGKSKRKLVRFILSYLFTLDRLRKRVNGI